MKKTDRIVPIILFFIVSLLPLHNGHAEEKGQWVKGKSSVFGSDFKKMRIEAVKRARADALNQAGIIVSASSFRLQTETNKEMNDYYSQFTEASSLGIITQERNVKISDPVRVSRATSNDEAVFQVDAELEAMVAIPEGNADPGFTVTLTSKKKTVRETEPVQLEITSSRAGYLTLLHVKNDTIQVAFPNGLSRNNTVESKKPIRFPKEYELYLTVDGDEQTSAEEFIAIITREDVPLITVSDAKIVGDELVLPKLSLTDLSQWLLKLPLNQRAIAHIVLSVVK